MANIYIHYHHISILYHIPSLIYSHPIPSNTNIQINTIIMNP